MTAAVVQCQAPQVGSFFGTRTHTSNIPVYSKCFHYFVSSFHSLHNSRRKSINGILVQPWWASGISACRESNKLSPKLPQAQGSLMTFHSNLSISSQYLESEYQMDLVSFPEVLLCSGPKADTLLLLLFFINARFYSICVPLGAASLGI